SANRQINRRPKESSIVYEPAIVANSNGPACGDSLRMYGQLNVGIFVVVIHQENGWRKEHVIFQHDGISGRNGCPPADSTSASKRDFCAAGVIVMGDIQPNILTNNDSAA